MKEQPLSNEISSGHVKNDRKKSEENKGKKENGKTKRDDKVRKLENGFRRWAGRLGRELEKQRRLRVCHSSIPVSLVEADILC